MNLPNITTRRKPNVLPKLSAASERKSRHASVRWILSVRKSAMNVQIATVFVHTQRQAGIMVENMDVITVAIMDVIMAENMDVITVAIMDVIMAESMDVITVASMSVITVASIDVITVASMDVITVGTPAVAVTHNPTIASPQTTTETHDHSAAIQILISPLARAKAVPLPAGTMIAFTPVHAQDHLHAAKRSLSRHHRSFLHLLVPATTAVPEVALHRYAEAPTPTAAAVPALLIAPAFGSIETHRRTLGRGVVRRRWRKVEKGGD